jgi:hypothetical protein
MLHAPGCTSALIFGLLICNVASAQSANLSGAWSRTTPGQDGPELHTEWFGQDGSYVSVERLPNGSMQRFWGSYRATPAGSGVMTVSFQAQGWLPHEICTQAPGFPARCIAYTPPLNATVRLQFTSASTLQINGATLRRDPSPALLQQQVPEKLMQQASAPMQPSMRQPVAPAGAHYQTPRDPGRPGGDDLQQERICAVNDGQIIVQQDGHKICIH